MGHEVGERPAVTPDAWLDMTRRRNGVEFPNERIVLLADVREKRRD
jgi:hypothetical protein